MNALYIYVFIQFKINYITHRFFRLDNFIHGPEQSYSEEGNWNNKKINKSINVSLDNKW